MFQDARDRHVVLFSLGGEEVLEVKLCGPRLAWDCVLRGLIAPDGSGPAGHSPAIEFRRIAHHERSGRLNKRSEQYSNQTQRWCACAAMPPRKPLHDEL
jgi:hypothetical protein